MWTHSRHNAMRYAAIMPIVVALSLGRPFAAQKTDENGGSLSKSCRGLHAGIRAQIIPPYTETPSVMLSFVLLNDSETAVDVEAGSWKIIVNGSELKDSGMLLGNGPMPEGGYRVLKPGETYEFGKALSIAQYFLPNGQYRVSWKGVAFQSPTIVVTITPASH
jgi:hypothetical protein